MKLKLMKELLDKYEKINQLLDQEMIEEAVEVIDKSASIIEQIQTLEEQYSLEDEQDVQVVKQQLLTSNTLLVRKFEELKNKRKPELINMSQKVQASQAYNNMRRNLY